VCRVADFDPVPADQGRDAAARGGGELFGVGEGEPGAAGRGGHGAAQRVFGGVLRSRGQGEHALPVESRPGQDPDLGQSRSAFGQGAGLVERHQGGGAERLHHDGGLDQDAVTACVGHRGQQRGHGGQDHGARRGDDHEGHRAQERGLQRRSSGQRNGEQDQRGDDHADRVALLHFLDEQLGPGLGRRRLLDHRHDPGHHCVRGGTVHLDGHRADGVDGAGEHLVARMLGDRHRFAGDGGLVHVTGAGDDSSVGGDPLAGAHQDHVADAQCGGRDASFSGIGDQARVVGRQVEQSADRLRSAVGGHRLHGSGRGEDDDEQAAVQDLADRCRADCGHHHQQVHVQGLLAQRPQAGQARLPAAGRVAGQEQ
jgi:hypothetical protein